MILTGPEILRQRRLGKIVIEPFSSEQLNPNSYDLRLSPSLKTYFPTTLRVGEHNRTEDLEIPPEGLLLTPGRLYIGSTIEHTETLGYAPRIEGKSSVGRLGIACHVTAGYGDNGFKGTWTLEIFVVQHVVILPLMRICQISYHELSGQQQPYEGKYQGQNGPTGSRSYLDMRKV